jgi:DNA polymerase III alpha subunit (gram-positive type)
VFTLHKGLNMNNLSVDIETFGTNTDSQILSIGACLFDPATGAIGNTFNRIVKLDPNINVLATPDTIKFWLMQAATNEKAVELIGKCTGAIATNVQVLDLASILQRLSNFIASYVSGDVIVWANGTKFDIGMIEYNYRKHAIEIPWRYNSDRCMRTLRQYAGPIDIDFEGTAHDALDDAIWQAKYISAALAKLNLL